MRTGRSRVPSGLFFLSWRKIDLAEATEAVERAFRAHRIGVVRTKLLSATSAQIETEQHSLRLALDEEPPPDELDQLCGTVLTVRAVRRAGAPQTGPRLDCDTILVCLLRALQKSLNADYIRLNGQESLFAGKDFLHITAPLEVSDNMAVSSAHTSYDTLPVSCKPTFPETRPTRPPPRALARSGAPQDQCDLFEAMRNPMKQQAEFDTQTSRDINQNTPLLRLSAWLLSFSVAWLCLPLGCMLVVINLLRGENLRLASQTAALTGTFISFQALGMITQASTVLQSFLT